MRLQIERLTKTNFNGESLQHYERTQEVHRVFRKVDGRYALVEAHYTEDWSAEKKREVAQNLQTDEMITYLALDGAKVIGFIGLLKTLKADYMILDLMQVSRAYRRQGIGRKLFALGKAEAEKAGAKGLYISACSSEETVAFYRAMGAEITETPIREMAEAEPFDLQMVCPIPKKEGTV